MPESPFTDPYGACWWCGCHHQGVCPRIKRMEYDERGGIRSVEFHDGGSGLVVPLPETDERSAREAS